MKINLAKLREDQNLTQEMIAKRMNRSQSTISKMEIRDLDELRIKDVRAYLKAIGAKDVRIF